MSTITLKSISIPVINIINKRTPKGESIDITLMPIVDPPSDTNQSNSKEYTGRLRIEICPKSEANSADKLFYACIEAEGTFSDRNNNIDFDKRKDAVFHDLLPYANSVLTASMSLAKVPSSLIPEGIFIEFDD